MRSFVRQSSHAQSLDTGTYTTQECSHPNAPLNIHMYEFLIVLNNVKSRGLCTELSRHVRSSRRLVTLARHVQLYNNKYVFTYIIIYINAMLVRALFIVGRSV